MREVITGGNELVAMGAIDAGCKFYGGYPIIFPLYNINLIHRA